MNYFTISGDFMKRRIIADSSCDLNDSLKEKLDISLVPFTIDVEDEKFTDDRDLEVNKLIAAMKKSPNPVKTSCPSPGDFASEYMGLDAVFAVTISSKLSGTYNAAFLAKEMIQEKYPESFIHVFDSKSASIGETLVAIKIQELIDEDLDNFDIVEKVEKYIGDMKTFFILESLDNLIKNGRISKTKGLVANILNLKPIMGDDGDGNIELVENNRGSKKAFKRLIQIIGENEEKFEEKTLGISHTNALEKAENLKAEIKKLYNFKDIVIVKTGGLSTAYANDGGIILAF